MSNDKHSVLYTGVTNDIKRRAYEHRNGLVEGFTKKYHVKYLVYYEEFNDIEYAIRREKQIKGGSRKKKEVLVNSINPPWRDLFEDVATF
jgi:putative endonuclease